MNIVFYLIIVLLLVFLWFMLTFLFKPIGRYIHRLLKDTKEILQEEDKESSNEEKEKER